ncbi:hypothetical protein PY365_20695 [Roseiarcaceae bacterium H3SJ34-1]|uniref:hypothetical protein n=1 Tax=Terripilifer ovatus TaxID=3032367 RepID=UPI003AB982B2|nr:hypothetical protein [Roseiarcaceae bacterium H3SJ34-1]
MSKINIVSEARNLMENATKRGRQDIYQLVFLRLCELEGKNYEDPVVGQFWMAVAAVEEVLRLKHGKAVKANYTRRKAANVGEIACLTDWALKKEDTEGFTMLVNAGLGDQTGEFVVVQNADRFTAEAVSSARERLIAHGVIVA